MPRLWLSLVQGLSSLALDRDGGVRDAALDALKTRLSEALDTHALGRGRGVFAKLSSRSPKDARTCERRAFDAVKHSLANLTREELTVNTVYRAVVKAGIEALRLGKYKYTIQLSLEPTAKCFEFKID